jgi:MoaA/NifB/PqqE/SkfB family radical SAM enzyme
MTERDWLMAIGQAAGLGATMIQLIGGEPAMSPAFPALLTYAVDAGLRAEVFTNLAHVTPALWGLFSMPGVRLAVSYYSDEPAGHDAITKVPGSHARTRANILRALERGIPLRTATVEILPGQRAAQARDEMAGLGVARSRIDRVRRIGRGNHAGGTPDAGELCGRCGDGRAAISPDGEVMPCVMSRWLAAGNIRRQPLDRILASAAWREALTQVPPRPATAACGPDSDGETDTCGPEIGCKPS